MKLTIQERQILELVRNTELTYLALCLTNDDDSVKKFDEFLNRYKQPLICDLDYHRIKPNTLPALVAKTLQHDEENDRLLKLVMDGDVNAAKSLIARVTDGLS